MVFEIYTVTIFLVIAYKAIHGNVIHRDSGQEKLHPIYMLKPTKT